MRSLWVIWLVLVAGCSSFNRDWKRAAIAPQMTNDVAGRWEGSWTSEKKGHHGGLRCLITPACDGVYNARFRAKFWKIFSFGYTAPLTVQHSNAVTRFTGQADLGKLAGGVYNYAGAVTGTNFHSTYESAYDHGHFRMTRAP